MNKNGSAKFLCHQDGDDLMPINSKFSGIFNRSLFTEKINEESVDESSMQNSSSEDSKKELSLSDYFKSLQL